MILGDFHLHSSHSEDSETPMEEQIEAGIKAGLKYMCFTEHMDPDWPIREGEKPEAFLLDTDSYLKHYRECRDKYADRIDLRFGVEYGFQSHLADHNREYVDAYPFDFVIGSQHLCFGMDVYYPEYFEGMTEKEAYRKYFESTLESVCLFDGYDILGHIDYVVRYGPNKNRDYSYRDHAEVIDEILMQLIKRGKGIELNTGGFRKLGNEPNPCTDILKRYRDLGGEIITVGSDAHRPASVAYDFARAQALLKDLGYSHYCIFKDRSPQFLDL
ncbi:MAG: histidinol-phosphatase HisJ family protein [Lachnospiraceae bacterium]|nr:histidinol-phosphatase HisJ family protein [Lachnospiraceae bacterium]